MNTLFRASVFKRGYNTFRDIIPPNIAAAAKQTTPAAAEATATAETKDFNKLISFYRRIPKGDATKEASARGLWARYQKKYFTGDKASPKPALHAIFALLIGGYSLHYIMHISKFKLQFNTRHLMIIRFLQIPRTVFIFDLGVIYIYIPNHVLWIRVYQQCL